MKRGELSRVPRTAVRGLLVLGAGAGLIASSGIAVASAAHATAGRAPSASRAAVRYAVLHRQCRAATPGHFSCLMVRRRTVAKGTPGAHAYRVPAGLTLGPSGGYTPHDLASAYHVNADGGKGQTVAVVDAYNDPKIVHDLKHFDAHYGLHEFTGSFRVVSQKGSPKGLPRNDRTGWSGEESLDVEAVRGLCHKCKIVLVETKSSSDTNFIAGVKAAAKLGADEISNSYGGPENSSWTTGRLETYYQAYHHPGVAVIASSGDDGWDSWDVVNDFADKGRSANAANLPATLPDVIAVGGTSLLLDRSAARTDEIVWNTNGLYDRYGAKYRVPLGASGGGCSTQYLAGGWQSNIANYADTGCVHGSQALRSASDVSADADPSTGLDIYASDKCGRACPVGWVTAGGTSLSSPLVAAMFALAGGPGGVKYPAMSLYAHAAANPGDFYDVTLGGNGFCETDPSCVSDIQIHYTGDPKRFQANPSGNPNGFVNAAGHSLGKLDCGYTKHGAVVADATQCEAATGYDGPSGVGTPKTLAGFKAVLPTVTLSAPTSVTAGVEAAFAAQNATDPYPGGAITAYQWTWGDGSASTSGATPSHTFAHAGTYSVTLTITDTYGQKVTRSATVTVGS
ncbi:MAG TPA: PKD domain-containing protein [Mycobacteriales bacterium]|nr:PKD domain-containing protein [Mycobacteriales bacterium]